MRSSVNDGDLLNMTYQATKSAFDHVVAPFCRERDAASSQPIFDEALQAMHLFGVNGPIVFALSALDIALWDIAGKTAGKPLYEAERKQPTT